MSCLPVCSFLTSAAFSELLACEIQHVYDVPCGFAGGAAALAPGHEPLRRLQGLQLRRRHVCRAQLRAAHFVQLQKRGHQARCREALRRSRAVFTCLRAMDATLRDWCTTSKAACACGRLAGARCFSSALRMQASWELVTILLGLSTQVVVESSQSQQHVQRSRSISRLQVHSSQTSAAVCALCLLVQAFANVLSALQALM